MIPRAVGIGLLALLAPGEPVAAADCRARPGAAEDEGIRAVVVTDGDADPAVASALRALGANTLVAMRYPNRETAAMSAEAGLRYVARVSTREVRQLDAEPARLAAVREISNLFGLQYIDLEVLEGYAVPETQRIAYETLKRLFPETLILYATRLDPIAWDPTYLDATFRPAFSDLVTPYYYPVASTPFGPHYMKDPWEERLRALLMPIAARLPPGKGVLPVLQAFAQEGFRVDASLVRRQWGVYEELFPENRNAAAFWWGGEEGPEGPLTGMSIVPQLQDGFRRLFGGGPRRPAPCGLPDRAAR
jgi:hypothetical protein